MASAMTPPPSPTTSNTWADTKKDHTRNSMTSRKKALVQFTTLTIWKPTRTSKETPARTFQLTLQDHIQNFQNNTCFFSEVRTSTEKRDNSRGQKAGHSIHHRGLTLGKIRHIMLRKTWKNIILCTNGGMLAPTWKTLLILWRCGSSSCSGYTLLSSSEFLQKTGSDIHDPDLGAPTVLEKTMTCLVQDLNGCRVCHTRRGKTMSRINRMEALWDQSHESREKRPQSFTAHTAEAKNNLEVEDKALSSMEADLAPSRLEEQKNSPLQNSWDETGKRA